MRAQAAKKSQRKQTKNPTDGYRPPKVYKLKTEVS